MRKTNTSFLYLRLQMDESRLLPMFRCDQIESGKLAKEWREWKDSLEFYFDSYQITDQKIKRSKMLHFGGPQLQKVFKSLEGTEDFPLVMLDRNWYDIAIDRLDAYFKPRQQNVLERHKLRKMKQESNESFAHFVLRLRQQLMDCGFEKYQRDIRNILEEIMLIDVIVEGCNLPELRRKILEKDQSLSDIEALGTSLESVRQQEKELKIGVYTSLGGQSEICKITTKGERQQSRILKRFASGSHKAVNNEVQIICYGCGQYGHFSKAPSCPARGQQCRRCRKTGQFEKVCRKRPFNPPPSFLPKKVQAIEDSDQNIPSVQKDTVLCSHEAEKKVYYTFYTGSQANVFQCKIGGVEVDVFVDSGSDVNIITSKSWDFMKAQKTIIARCEKGSAVVLKAYGNNKPLTILGTFDAVVEIGKRSTISKFFVVEDGQRNLLGDKTSKELGILKIGLEVNQVFDSSKMQCSPFPKISGVQVRILMNPSVVPVFQPLRRVPIHLENAVNRKLDELLKRDIIEEKKGPATWVSPLVVVNKTNGSIRLCVDLRRVNQAVIRERHPMPIIEDVLARIGRGKIWSILDVMDAFFLLELDDKTKDIMTFISHRGLYRFKRLPFGLISAPEIFQRTMDEILADCEGAYWYLDDVGVEGSTIEQHDQRLNKVLRRFKNRGVVLNWGKCRIRVTEFEFLGYKICSDGIMPSDIKRDAVLDFRRPTNESEVRSFLGLANYMGKFIPNLAEIDEPLRRLIQKGNKFRWGEAEEIAFTAIKSSLSEASCLGFFRAKDNTSLFADASPVALGAVLIQTNDHGDTRVVCYASKSLTDTEKRYCQTEKEALSLVWSVEKFQVCLIGREFSLLTDCKALTFLFAPASRPCARIERWVLRLQSFTYKIIHIPGQSNIADVLSRLSTNAPKPFDEAEELVVQEIIIAGASTVALKWEEIESVSREDEIIRQVIEALNSGTTNELPLSYRVISSELCSINNVLLRGDRIIIPHGLQQRVLNLAHEGHPGIRMMKGHLRANVWWPKMDQHIEQFVKACRGCTLVSAPNPPEPIIRKELPSRPWEQIAIDFLGPLPDGKNLLVCIDYYTRYLEVIEMRDMTTASTIDELLTIFSRYGLPDSLRADNGPQFSSEEFKAFCEEQGIDLENCIPYWPQMNGEVERQNRSILKRLRIAQELGHNWRRELHQYLLTYHSAVHPTTGKSPAELMFGRRLRTKLPCIPAAVSNDEEVRDYDRIQKEKGRVYTDCRRKARSSSIEIGDRVLAKRTIKENKLSSDFSPEEYIVIKKNGTDVTIRSESSGKEFRRSVTHLKRISQNTFESDDLDENVENQNVMDTNPTTTESAPPLPEISTKERSKRLRAEPSRFEDYVAY
ncbi:uncharacterized protein K02A2.6-like [Toxorhynchites rutilus septentrionalis]|uniref:uncharacterized protein K02A2.6-like n=1 Tax=Toxorhynchites rutilus septentrionalis TaxID=329112 RepID=UPI002479568D|nr:uncharacterized protein K02A2.6-like [Toxorhynchites rutilus septentrionalis]